jgi:hypothetical protein
MGRVTDGSIIKVERLNFDDKELAEFFGEHSSLIFNRLEWSEVLKEGVAPEVVSYVLRKDGKIILALPGIILNFKILKMFYSNVPYGGFVGEVEHFQQFVELLETRLRKDGIHCIRIGKEYQTQFPEMKGYQKELAYTHILNVGQTTVDLLWKNYKKRVRRDVRKAEKSNITISEVIHPKEIDTLFNLYLQTMKRNEAYNVWTRQTLYAIYRLVVQKGWGKILLARLRDEIIAGIILIFSPETTYYFFAASNQKYFSLCPNDLLVHQAICLTIQQGRKYFDLMTSQKDDVALMNFKEKWGAEKHPFYFYEKRMSPIRTRVWGGLWWLGNTSLGARSIRWWRGN